MPQLSLAAWQNGQRLALAVLQLSCLQHMPVPSKQAGTSKTETPPARNALGKKPVCLSLWSSPIIAKCFN